MAGRHSLSTLLLALTLICMAACQQICIKQECSAQIAACDLECQKLMGRCTFDCTLSGQGCLQDCMISNSKASALLECSYNKCLSY